MDNLMQTHEGQEDTIAMVYNTLADIEYGTPNLNAIMLINHEGVLNVISLNTPPEDVPKLLIGTLHLLSTDSNMKEAN